MVYQFVNQEIKWVGIPRVSEGKPYNFIAKINKSRNQLKCHKLVEFLAEKKSKRVFYLAIQFASG